MELKIAFIDSTSKYLITRSVLITGGHFSTNYVCLPVYALLRLMTSDHFVPETFLLILFLSASKRVYWHELLAFTAALRRHFVTSYFSVFFSKRVQSFGYYKECHHPKQSSAHKDTLSIPKLFFTL